MKKTTQYIWIYIFIIAVLGSCKKDWLDIRSNKKLIVPTTIANFQALLDGRATMSAVTASGFQVFTEVGTDNLFLEYNTWQTYGASETTLPIKNAYVFEKNIFENATNSPVWTTPYKRIFYANVALDGLNKIVPSSSQMEDYNRAKGSALFLRAHAFYWVAQLFAPPFDAENAVKDLGIPLRLDPDISIKTNRSTLGETYTRIIEDLKEAEVILPLTAIVKARPTKAACLAMLARTYLSMKEYDSSLYYADKCLKLNGALLDYNSLDSAKTYPIIQYNTEVLYDNTNGASIMGLSTGRVDTTLYKTYEKYDLRKPMYFKPRAGTSLYTFNGSYDGSSLLFTGIARDEVYLIRAECFARKEMIAEAMGDLNLLLLNRWQKDKFTPVVANTSVEALKIILQERRKELCFRGLRWTDLRRLNKDINLQVTVKRELGGTMYLLPPNSPKYVYPIPMDVIEFTGIVQNNR